LSIAKVRLLKILKSREVPKSRKRKSEEEGKKKRRYGEERRSCTFISLRRRLKKLTFFWNVIFSSLDFCTELSYFSRPGWLIHFQILQETQCTSYLSSDTKNELFLCCMRP
jgi:hypothetical protein